MSVYVITPAGKQLMPTSEYRARKLLKSGKAVIFEHRPFTIMLTRVVSENVQPANCQFDMIQDEKSIRITARRCIMQEEKDVATESQNSTTGKLPINKL